MNIRNEIIEPDCYYHIFNRGINGDKIFNIEENYKFFLQKFSKYLNGLCEVYAYCLMPNHFHFAIRIKSNQEIIAFAENSMEIKINVESGLHSFDNIVSKQIGKFISSYSQAFNKVNKRHGPLLESPFKRIKIDSEEYLKNLILYIHSNPIDLEIAFDEYRFSSYQAILSNSKTYVKKNEVIELFGGSENFVYCHHNLPKYSFNF